jgi:hypothetical protein
MAVATYDIGRRTGSRTAADEARGLLEKALGLAQRAGDRVVEARALQNLGEQRGDLYSTYAHLRRDLSEEDLSKTPLRSLLVGFREVVGLASVVAVGVSATVGVGDTVGQ